VTFEVTGTNRGLDLAEAVTRMSGKLCIVGYHQGGTREIRLGYWNWMAFNIVNAHFRDKGTILSGMRTGLRLVEAGLLDPTPLFTNSYPLESIEEAFQTAAAKQPGFVKAVVRT
jgi:threonine dehydrogenase-like Zn-dependent dehydrogenase